MKYYLYTFKQELSHDLEIEGFAILTEIEKDIALTKILKKFKNGGTLSYGDVEEVEFDTLSELMDCFSFKNISASEYKAINKTFGVTSFGEVGPLDASVLHGGNFCEDCGAELADDYSAVCSDCEDDFEEDEEDDDDMYEDEYNAEADTISKFIKSEYGLEETPTSDYHTLYVWKPTPSTEIHITIEEYDDGDEDVDIHLRYKGKDVGYETFKVEDVWSNPGAYLRTPIKNLIQKAKKY